MSDKVVYRSTDPGVLAAWKEACAAISEYLRQTQKVLDAAGLAGRSVWRSSSGWNWGEVRGIAVLSLPGMPENPIPEGWRIAAGKDYAVPDMRTSAGRKVTAALRAVPHPGEPTQRLIGMPADVLAGAGRIWTPDVRVLGGAVAAGNCQPGVCPHRRCCNPRHLAAKTRLQHVADSPRRSTPSGSANPNARLTENQAAEIRVALGAGQLQREIALRFGVSQALVSQIKRGVAWPAREDAEAA